MNAVRVYAPNSGQFRRGFTPWNKGTGKGGRKDAAQKGAVGFQPREVVAINPDGTVYRRFKSVEAAKDFFGLRDRHSITHACKGRFLCRGFRLFYGEDYIPWGITDTPGDAPGTSTDGFSPVITARASGSRTRNREGRSRRE